MYKIGIILVTLFALSQSLPREFPGGIFKTSNDRFDYYDVQASSNESTPFNGRFKFKIRASSNTSISFSTRANNTGVEFLIGVSWNMETRLRINNTDFVIMKTPKILNGSDFKTFEITWMKNVFHFAEIDEKKNDQINLMLYKTKFIFPINYIGLKTVRNGAWFIRERDSPRVFDSYIKTMNSTVLQIGNSLRCMVIQTKNDSVPIYVHTQSSPIEERNYTYVNIPNQNCYNIHVRAKLDAHIAFTNVTNFPVVELHLRPQGSFNLTVDYNRNQIDSKFVQDLLNDREYRSYWIEYIPNTGKLSIGKMGESALIVNNISFFRINSIGVLTTNGNVGDWVIKRYGSCPGNKDEDINEDGFWGDARTRCYIENPLQ